MTAKSYPCTFSPGYAPAYGSASWQYGATSYSFPAINNVMFDGAGDKSVSAWENNGGYFPDLEQSTATNQPSLASGVYTFDGTDNYFTDEMSDTTAAPTSTQKVPDAASTLTVGQGFPCTGLAINRLNGQLIVGNHGGVAPHPDSTLNASVCILSADATELIRECIMDTGDYGDDFSVQGVAWNNKTTNYYALVKDTGGSDDVILELPMTATSSDDAVRSISVNTTTNGIAFNPLTDEIYAVRDNGQVDIYPATGGASTGTLCTFSDSNIDMLYFCPVNNILWLSSGANAANGRIRGYSVAGDYFGDLITVTDSLAIEGFALSADGMTLTHVANDAFYHNGGSEEDHIAFYNYDLSQQVAKLRPITEMQIDFLYHLLTSTSTTEVIYALGDPLSGLAMAIYQVGSDDDRIRVIVHNGTTSESINLDFGAAFTTKSHITLRIDFANKEIKAYQNGVLQDTQNWTLAYTSCRYIGQAIGGNYDGSGSRFLHFEIDELYVNNGILSDADTDSRGNDWDEGEAWTWTNLVGVDFDSADFDPADFATT